MSFIMTNRTRLGSQKIPFVKRKSIYITKYNQYKDIGIVGNGKLIMSIFV